MILVRREVIGIDMNLHRIYPYIFLTYLLLFSQLLGCQDNYGSVSFVKVESERTQLINGIESYQSIDEFKALLSRSSLQWVESEKKPSPKGRPPYNVQTITVKSYSHLGFAGELWVAFFNNRLVSTTFYPLDAEKYIAVLAKTERVQFSNDKETNLPPFTRLKIAVDYKKRTYIDWSDSRLDKEMQLWIKKYS